MWREKSFFKGKNSWMQQQVAKLMLPECISVRGKLDSCRTAQTKRETNRRCHWKIQIWLFWISLNGLFICYCFQIICHFQTRNKVWQGFSRVRLICGTADRGTAGPAEPKEMAVLLQLPLANVLKWLVAINFYNNWAISHPLIGRKLLSITVQTTETGFCRFRFSITDRELWFRNREASNRRRPACY